MERLRHEISARVGDSVLAAVSMRVYAHGVEPGPDGVAFPPVDLLIENFVHAARAGRGTTPPSARSTSPAASR